MTITWNNENASTHLTKHHVPFTQAARVFNSPDRRTFRDPQPNRYNETRYVTIGTVDKRTLFVVYTKDDDVITIISARRLTRRQQVKFKEASTP